MVDDKDQNSTDEFDNLDEEIELDLFADDDEQSADEDLLADENTLFENSDDDFDVDLDASLDENRSDNPDTGLAQEFEVELDDNLDSDLDDDIIDLSDDEVAREFADLELEESAPQPQIGDDLPTDDTLDLDEEAEADDVYKNITSEEFGAPDQYTSESGAKTESKSQSASADDEQSGLPAMLAAFAGLSPRMIVAATAAVLLPVVVFTILGFNSDESDADETASSPFQDGSLEASNNEQQDTDNSSTFSVTRSALPAQAAAQDSPAAETTDAEANLSPETESLAESDPEAEPEVLANSEIESSESAALEPALLAQAQVPAPPTEPDQNTTIPAQETEPDRVDSPQPQGTSTSPEPVTRAVSSPPQAPENTPDRDSVPASDNPTSQPAAIADTDNNGRNYHVIVASFPSEAVARQHAEQISSADRQAYLIPPFGDASNYRVAIAAYRSMAEARDNIPGLREQFGTGIWPLRYPPSPGIRIVDSPSGETFIIVASFPNEQLARTHAAGLVRQGEQPVIIAPYAPSNRYRVAVSHYDTTSNAENALPRFRENYGEDAWLLRY